jgi:ribosomal-protein-alanine N-acetyltransferase
VRATTGADISWLTELRQDAIVRRFLGGPIERERAEGHALVLASSSNSFIVTMRDTGARLGLVRLSDERHGGLEVSYEFLPWTWRSGYATEALRALLDWVFDSIQPEAPLAVTQTANESSRRLLARLGAELENGFEEFGRPQLQYRWSAVRKADPKRLEVESPAS